MVRHSTLGYVPKSPVPRLWLTPLRHYVGYASLREVIDPPQVRTDMVVPNEGVLHMSAPERLFSAWSGATSATQIQIRLSILLGTWSLWSIPSCHQDR